MVIALKFLASDRNKFNRFRSQQQKSLEKVMLVFEYNRENCPLAIAKMTSRFLETTKVSLYRTPDLNV